MYALPPMQESSLYISSKEIINQSFSEGATAEVVPPRTVSKNVKMTNTMALWNARQDLILKLYQTSRDNYELKKNIAYLDSRISCLARLFHTEDNNNNLSDHKRQLYGSMISVLQSEPVHYARLLINSQLSDTDRLIRIAIESLFQKTDRDEYLLLILIQVI